MTLSGLNSLQHTCIWDFKLTLDVQQAKLSELETKLNDKTKLVEELELQMSDHIENTNEKFEIVKDGVEEARSLANDVEAHGRRWAIRILGIAAPVSKNESTDQAKEHVLKFLTYHLNINNIQLVDLDCAHRIGGTKNGKQTILAWFFRRDCVDQIL